MSVAAGQAHELEQEAKQEQEQEYGADHAAGSQRIRYARFGLDTGGGVTVGADIGELAGRKKRWRRQEKEKKEKRRRRKQDQCCCGGG